jgi:hypothetical protein
MSHFGPLIITYVGTCNRRQSDASVEMSFETSVEMSFETSVEMSFERSVEMSRTLTPVV